MSYKGGKDLLYNVVGVRFKRPEKYIILIREILKLRIKMRLLLKLPEGWNLAKLF